MARLSRPLLHASLNQFNTQGFNKRRLCFAIVVALLGNGPLEVFATSEPAPPVTPVTKQANQTSSSISVLDLPIPELGSPESMKLDEQILYLDVYFGERSTKLIGQFHLRDGRLYSTPKELRELGLVVDPNLTLDSAGLLALDALPGLTYRYDIAQQRLLLTVPVALRPQQVFGYQVPEPVSAVRGRGVLLNYDAFARNSSSTDSLAIATELRWFGRAGALELTGISRTGTDANAYGRLNTRWTYSDPKRLWTWTAGDIISGSLSWSRSVRLGGLQWRRNFGVRPDLITFPVPRFSGAATVPSAVDLLVNNIEQYSTDVNDGPFAIDAFPRISGAGEVTVVVRDALGRSTQTTVPIYVDYRRLAPGLSDFSLEAGVLREGFGSKEDKYNNDPILSVSWRRGLSHRFTLETHIEEGPELHLAGIGGVWSPAGRWGLVTASVVRSTGLEAGYQRTLGYQWIGRRFGLDIQSQRRSIGFRDLGNLVANIASGDSINEQDRASFWVPVPRGSLAVTWLRSLQNDGDEDYTRSLSWSQSLGRRLSLSASAFSSQSSGHGAGLHFSMPLGQNISSSVSLDQRQGRTQTTASLSRTADYGGGWGWQMQAGDRQGGFAQASAKFRGRWGEVWFGSDHIQDTTSYFFQGAGSLVWMDNQTFVSRRINDSFAVVSSNGVANVPVFYENRAYGRVNERGYLLLPDFRGWQRNRIAIDPDTLGVNYRAPDLEQFVTPADNTGVLVKFPIIEVHSAMVGLLDAKGIAVPAGSRGKVLDSDEAFLVGFEGEAYLENFRVGTVLELNVAGTLCRYHLPTTEKGLNADTIIRLGPLMCEVQPQ